MCVNKATPLIVRPTAAVEPSLFPALRHVQRCGRSTPFNLGISTSLSDGRSSPLTAAAAASVYAAHAGTQRSTSRQ